MRFFSSTLLLMAVITPLVLLPLPVLADNHANGSAGENSVYSYKAWQNVLTGFVDEAGYVDYVRLAQNRRELDQYLNRVAASGPVSTPGLFPDKDHELAYYINAYNANVFRGVIDTDPARSGVWGFFGTGIRFFDSMEHTVDGLATSLSDLENNIIRARFNDPRIHAAINCASVSCPRLSKQAYLGDTLNDQLNRAFSEFVNNPEHVRIKGKTVYLSAIFDWFRADFTANDSDQEVLAYINRFRDSKLPEQASLAYLPYNKDINSLANSPDKHTTK